MCYVFAFTSLLVPRMVKSWAGAWERGNAFVWAHMQVSEIWHVIKTRTLLRGLDEVCQLLHGVGQLLYEVHLLTASGGVAGGHKSSWKVYKTFDSPSLTPVLIS